MTGSNSVSSNWMGQIPGEEPIFTAIGETQFRLASSGVQSEMSIYGTRSRTILLPSNDFRDNEPDRTIQNPAGKDLHCAL